MPVAVSRVAMITTTNQVTLRGDPPCFTVSTGYSGTNRFPQHLQEQDSATVTHGSRTSQVSKRESGN